jgi:hydrogenase maturation protein HypF
VGDLDNVSSVEVHQRAVRDLVDFFRVVPEAVACDLHPDYASTRHAERLAKEWNVPLVRVQHHHAHVASCVAEHQLEGPVLGFAWDGTGYGSDGTVWGGEALVWDHRPQGPHSQDGGGFQRVAHLRTFALPGGDQAVRQPRRSALGVLFEILPDKAAELAAVWFSESELHTLLAMLGRSIRSPRSSSMGRLFDAVAALCGLPAKISFEGQAAMALEFAADPAERGAHPLPLSSEEPAVADWEPLIQAALEDRAAGEPVSRISARFHNALANLAVQVAERWGGSRVVLSGGCFQNALLSERVRARLLESGFRVYTHLEVPPGDGGIALGQLAVARQRLEGS